MNEKKETFSYDYSAKQQSEIKAIREKYENKTVEVSKMEELRKLDKSVWTAGRIPSIILGIIGTLIMGLGMSCTLVWQGIWFIPGIVIGVVGLIGIILAYPLNNWLVNRRKKKLAPQILRLTDELMK